MASRQSGSSGRPESPFVVDSTLEPLGPSSQPNEEWDFLSFDIFEDASTGLGPVIRHDPPPDPGNPFPPTKAKTPPGAPRPPTQAAPDASPKTSSSSGRLDTSKSISSTDYSSQSQSQSTSTRSYSSQKSILSSSSQSSNAERLQPMDLSQAPLDAPLQVSQSESSEELVEEPPPRPRHWVPRPMTAALSRFARASQEGAPADVPPMSPTSTARLATPRGQLPRCAVPECRPSSDARRHRIPFAMRDEWIQGCVIFYHDLPNDLLICFRNIFLGLSIPFPPFLLRAYPVHKHIFNK